MYHKSFIIYYSLLFVFNFVNSQNNKSKTRVFSNADIQTYEIFENKYDMWSFENIIQPKGDTITRFVDVENYKGILNYGVELSTRDKKTVNFTEDYVLYFLKVNLKKIQFFEIDSIVEIKGNIDGGWDFFDFKNEKIKDISYVSVGELTNTEHFLNFYPQYYFPDIYIIKYNRMVMDSTFTLDTLPALKYEKYRTKKKVNGRGEFTIKCKINEKSILIIGKYSCYTKFYNIGEMIFSNNKKAKVNVDKPIKNAPRFNRIIEKNVQVKEQLKLPPKKEINYYTYSGHAEQFIISKQYAKAKEQYFLLEKNYATLFATDIHNAIRCAILSRDMKTAFMWSEKLAKKGVGLTYFNSRIFTGMRKNPEWKNFITKYDSILKITNDNFNTKLQNEIIGLLNEDQADYGLKNRKEPQVLYETTERVTNKLISLLEEEGFPSEEKIGAFTKNDTILITAPDYNVILRHAVQQKPKELDKLIQLLNKSQENFEYDMKRSGNHRNFPSACLHIYKGNLYNDKSCGLNELGIKQIKFKFNNPYGFIMDYGDFIVSEYDKENPKEWDDYYEQNFNFIMKLTDDWEFYDK